MYEDAILQNKLFIMIKNIIKFLFVSLLSIVGLTVFSANGPHTALAAGRTNPFSVGETLDPGAELFEPCGPTDANCFPAVLGVDDEGSSLTGNVLRFNFVGAGVTATNNGGIVTVSVSGGGLSALTDGKIYIGNASNLPTEQTLSGDASLSNAGIFTISNNSITHAKLADDSVDSLKIIDGSIVDADINSSANIALSKIANGASIITSLATPAGSNADGGSISANVLTLSLADGINPGLVSIGTQTFAGDKTFAGDTTMSGLLVINGMLATRKGVDFSTIGTTNDAILGNTSLVRLTGTSSQTLTGISAGADGQLLTLVNAGNNPASITNNDTVSLASNRIITGTNTSLTVAPGASIRMVYDTGSSVWRVIGNGAYIPTTWGTILGTLSDQADLQNALDAKQDLLGFTAEDGANKSLSIVTDQSSYIKYPSVKAVYDWATGVFTTASAVSSQITTALSGYATESWVNSQGFITNIATSLGFTPENVANKDTDGTLSANSDIKYTSQKAIKTFVTNGLTGKQDSITTGTTAQYLRGDLSLGTFPTNNTAFTNGAGYLTSISGLNNSLLTNDSGYLTGNQNITLTGAITGSGTTSIATMLANSIVGTANLSASGTPSSSTYLRGDNTWATISGGGGGIATLSAIGATPNANGSTITGTVLNLEPANAAYGGAVTTVTQSFAGRKTFTNGITLSAGTATAGTSPIKLTSGTNLTVEETGAMEFDGSSLFFTHTQRAGVIMTGLTNYNTFSQSLKGATAFTTGTHNVLLGNEAGNSLTTATSVNFLGYRAGYNATNATYSNFLGNQAGSGATNATNSNFLGYLAGQNATNATYSNFLGQTAGANATGANYSNFLGYQAGNGATNARNSNFFGNLAGKQATNAYFSNFFGFQVGQSFTGNNVGNNNIIIGTNISLPNAVNDSMNIGGVLFGTGFYNTVAGSPSITAVSTGKIGIGTTTPLGLLDVGNTTATTSSILTRNSTSLTVFDATSIPDYNGTIIQSTYPGGSVGQTTNIVATGADTGNWASNIAFWTRTGGGTNASQKMSLNGAGVLTINNLGTGSVQSTAGVLSVSSDERLKDISGMFTKGLDALAGVNPISYTWNASSGLPMGIPMTGFSAQNIQANIPEGVTINPDGFLGLQDRAILATSVNAIKELDIKIKNVIQSMKDFVTDKITAINGYFENLFAKNIETENLCIADETSAKTCVTKQQLDALLNAQVQPVIINDVVIPPPVVPDPIPEISPEPIPVIEPEPAIDSIPEGVSESVSVVTPVPEISPTE